MGEQQTAGRLYTIQNDALDFFTGINNRNNQVLLGILFPECVAVEFDQAGNYLHITTKPLSPEAFDLINGIYRGKTSVSERELAQFKVQIGFAGATIHVRKFFLEERYLGIEDYPEEATGSEPDYIDLDEWKANQQFVLWWGKDYWMSAEGEIEST